MKRSYYAIIPADVRYDKELTPNAKLLYGEITALCNEKGYCWANNSYFAELYKVSKETVSRWISELEKLGYIRTELIYEQGTKLVKERRIYIVDDPIDKNINRYRQNNQYPIDENVNTPIDENIKENNTISNITFNNTEDIESTSSDVPYKEIVQAYNDICKSLPSVKVISDKRKKKMRVIYREVGDLDIITEAFKKAENSDFLSGRNGKWGGCNFDWLINYNNFIKVIEGTYDNKNGLQGGDNGPGDQNHSQNKYGW